MLSKLPRLNPIAKLPTRYQPFSRTLYTVAVVGSGPAGFYCSQKLLKSSLCSVDMYEKLPIPFGLVRFGVAPDHPEVKNVTTTFDTVAANPNFKFFGNCSLVPNTSFNLDTLLDNYNKVVLATGCPVPKRLLKVPSNCSTAVIPASHLVDWYNGHPSQSTNVNLKGIKKVTVIGHGNVALDIARILLTPTDLLHQYDIPDPVLDVLKTSEVEEVRLLGRRGPLQAQFTTKELKELLKVPHLKVSFDRKLVEEEVRKHESKLKKDRPLRRLMETLLKYQEPDQFNKICYIDFLSSPSEVKLENEGGTKVKGLEVIENTLSETEPVKAIPTQTKALVLTDLIVEAVGYQPNNEEHNLYVVDGRVHNLEGQVLDKDGNPVADLSVAGWLKTGPKGTIATTMHNAFHTADSILEQMQSSQPTKLGFDLEKLNKLGLQPTTYHMWKKLDTLERNNGENKGKLREKICNLDEMLKVIRG